MTLRETRIRTENNEKIQQQLEKLREYERKEEQEKFRLSQLRQSRLANVVYVQETLKNVIFFRILQIICSYLHYANCIFTNFHTVI